VVLRDWLAQFAYRIDMPLSAFIAAGLASLLIVCAAVTTHTARVARTSPISVLRHE